SRMLQGPTRRRLAADEGGCVVVLARGSEQEIITAVSANRMGREQFFRVMSGLDEDRLRKALWNLYWRGTASVRERIEVELAHDGRGRPPRPAKPPVDPETVRFEVDDVVSLA